MQVVSTYLNGTVLDLSMVITWLPKLPCFQININEIVYVLVLCTISCLISKDYSKNIENK